MFPVQQRQRARERRAATPPAIPVAEVRPPVRKKRASKTAPPPAPPKVSALASRIRVTTGMEVAPLHLFQLSDLNSRKIYRDDQVEEMAGLIERWGVQQNLLVVPHEEGELGVVAGGRRLRALWLLRSQGKIDDSFEVPFQLARTEDGRELSLMENVSRVALTPFEEIEAYTRIVAEHPDEPDPYLHCANRQGVTRAHVEGMLRLGKLPAEILNALRDDRIDLAAARAYGSTTDAKAQLLVFHVEERRSFAPHKPTEIRHALRMKSYPADGPEAFYVGLDAYQAAGGQIVREMFMGADGGERLTDRDLLQRLARAKAAAELARHVERDGFASGLLTKGFSALPEWPAVPAGHKLGGMVSDPATMSTKPAFAVRPTAIGVYTLQGRGLAPIGWFEPIPAPASAAAPDRAVPSEVARPRPAALPTLPADHEPEAEMEQLRARSADRRAKLIDQRAAMLAARALATAAMTDARIAPDDRAFGNMALHDLVEPLPDGDVLVTIQVRVSRDELDAQRAVATAELDAEVEAGEVAA